MQRASGSSNGEGARKTRGIAPAGGVCVHLHNAPSWEGQGRGSGGAEADGRGSIYAQPWERKSDEA